MGRRKLHNLLVRLGRCFAQLPTFAFDRKTQFLIDGVIAAISVVIACSLRFEFVFSKWFLALAIWIPVLAVARPFCLFATKGYGFTWRHFHLMDGLELATKSVIVTVILVLLRIGQDVGLPIKPLPFSVALIELNVFVLVAGSVRILRRLTFAALRPAGKPTMRTLLIADEGSVAGAVRSVDPYSDVHVIGILTDEVTLQGRKFAGIPVLGTLADFEAMIAKWQIESVFLAGSNFHSLQAIVGKASEFGVQVRIVPTPHDLVHDRVRVSRTLEIEQIISKRDLLTEEPHPEVVSSLRGRCVLVTGAGGSIGSEISRQVAQLPVSRIILLDQDENSIFELMNELSGSTVKLTPCIGDIRDSDLLEMVFDEYRPAVVLHAAAYKHVPMMESNSCEAVLNNVTGTRQLIETSEKYGCERFVMISTDKAVRPSSIMGATKKTAELLVQLHSNHSGRPSRTKFACVRFGNVVGSRGSVVPIFLRQIAAGGPITITHEEMTRYFMSIPQAVQLVLQAASLASSGDIFMLDMGDPVKIIDFARDLIRMSGLHPDSDIPIRIVGTRPGEKLHEQLWREDAEISNTRFPYVFQIKARSVESEVEGEIALLEGAAERRADADEIRELLSSLPIDYQHEESVITYRFPVAFAPTAHLTANANAGDD